MEFIYSPGKDWIINILGFMGPVVSVLMTQLYCCSEKVVIDNTNQYDYVAVNFIYKTGGRLGLVCGL